jgi:2-polyprenyl-3-methyl-5-hydroxy-6-metoxy-1,4-benzoquinol methylase
MLREDDGEIPMMTILTQIYRTITQPLQDRWLGGLHAGLVIKGLYLQWMVAPFLRQGHKRVLDAGCGPEAQLVAMLAGRYPTCTFSGWDLHLSPEGRSRDRHPENLSVFEADLVSLNEKERYDLVYTVDVLEHIEDCEDMLDRLSKAVIPGGLLFIHTPSLEERVWFAASRSAEHNAFREHRTGDDHVHEGFSIAQLTHALERRSFSVIQAKSTFGGVVAWLKEIFSLCERRGIKGIGLLLLPAVVLSVIGEILVAPRRGNGVYVLGVKNSLGAFSDDAIGSVGSV